MNRPLKLNIQDFQGQILAILGWSIFQLVTGCNLTLSCYYSQNGSCVLPNFKVSCPIFKCRIRRSGNSSQRFAPNVPIFQEDVRASLSNSIQHLFWRVSFSNEDFKTVKNLGGPWRPSRFGLKYLFLDRDTARSVLPNFKVSCPIFRFRIRRSGNSSQRFAPNVPILKEDVRASLSNFKFQIGAWAFQTKISRQQRI